MNDNNAFVVDIATLLPPRYRAEEVLGRIYGQPGIANDILTLATRASRTTGVTTFSSVLDFDAYPSKRLVSERHTPKRWCCSLIEALSIMRAPDDVGFLSVSYNITSHADVLPNLACQVAHERKLRLVAPPQELPYHGCAAAILQIASAVDFCRRSNKAALVIVLDQCTWAYRPVRERDSEDFRASLRAHLLFSDGAAALMIVPESMIGDFPHALRIVDIDTGFRLGDTITMRNGHFLVGDDVGATMPALVASESIRPLLARHDLEIADIRDWAIHQGGLPVLRKFTQPEVLGLSDAQLADSSDSFAEYGNLSAASCLFTLRRQFERTTVGGTKGIAAAFGAGYYFGSVLYERWTNASATAAECPAARPATMPP